MIVLSAHLDDAVLSATTALTRYSATAVTVFSGPPPDGVALTRWDRVTRAESSHDRLRERLAEDDRAVSVLGCRTRRLDVPEAQYRVTELDFGDLVARLRREFEGEHEVWAPAGIGGHPDHIATRDAALAAVRELAERPDVTLYADVPYALRYGWPSWVDGREPRPYLNIDAWFDWELAERGLDAVDLKPQVAELQPAERLLKAAAVRAYRSQLPSLCMEDLGDPDSGELWGPALKYEVAWRLLV